MESQPGRGTTFEIRFPRTEAVAGLAPRPASPPARAGHETILVVEDDPRVRAVTVRALRAAGHRVLVARTARRRSPSPSSATPPSTSWSPTW